MTITTLPTAPLRTMSPAEFVAAANTFLAALPTFSSQVNADLSALLTLSQLVSTSTTSLTIGTGSKSLTVQTSKAYLVNQVVRIYNTVTPDNYMGGTVTSYDSGTGALVVNVTATNGSGTLTAWTVILNGGLATSTELALRALLGGSATQSFACSALGIGTTAAAYYGAQVAAALSGAPNPSGYRAAPTFGSDSTGAPSAFAASPSTEAAAFTAASLVGFRASGFTLGAGSTVTDYYAIYADAEANATNNYGAYIADNSGVGIAPNSTSKFRAAGVDSSATKYVIDLRDGSDVVLFNVRNDGRVMTGASTASPYNNTTASAANCFIQTDGGLQRSTSSLRFKANIEDMLPEYADAVIYKARPVFYRSTCEADNPLHSYWGLIAEELAHIDPRFVFWGKPMHTVVKSVERIVVKKVPRQELRQKMEEFITPVEVVINGAVTVQERRGTRPVFDAEGRPVLEAVEVVEKVSETVTEQVEVTETDEEADPIPDGVMYDRLVVALILDAQQKKKTIAAQQAAIDSLLKRVLAIESK